MTPAPIDADVLDAFGLCLACAHGPGQHGRDCSEYGHSHGDPDAWIDLRQLDLRQLDLRQLDLADDEGAL